MSQSTPHPDTVIAYQGAPGANSDLACRQVFPEMTSLPCVSFEDAFAAVTEGRAKLAMIPVENSVAGRVADIHHLLPRGGLHMLDQVQALGAAVDQLHFRQAFALGEGPLALQRLDAAHAEALVGPQHIADAEHHDRAGRQGRGGVTRGVAGRFRRVACHG